MSATAPQPGLQIDELDVRKADSAGCHAQQDEPATHPDRQGDRSSKLPDLWWLTMLAWTPGPLYMSMALDLPPGHGKGYALYSAIQGLAAMFGLRDVPADASLSTAWIIQAISLGLAALYYWHCRRRA